MTPVNIRNDYGAKAQKIILAEHQLEYQPLPCLFVRDQGYVITEWQPNSEELAALVAGGRVRLWTYTFGQPFQPLQMVAVGPDEMLPLETVS